MVPASLHGSLAVAVVYSPSMTLRLGYNTGYWSAGPPAGALDGIKEADRLGFHSVWTAEAYGSDALTPLAWWGSQTTNVQLGTGILQMSARTPTATAMAALTLDHLSGGRFICGIGASGPQVVEGWYGEPYPKPLARTREYIDVMKQVWAREKPVEHQGAQYQIPYRGSDATGLGKALKPTVHPLRRDIPIYLGAEGPKNVALAGELCDGWLPLFFSPKEDAHYRRCLAEGFAAAGDPAKSERFEVACGVTIVPGDDVEKCADMVRPFVALYAGGMGAKGANFHFEVFARMGWEEVATKVQELYLAGRKDEAIASIPLAMVEDIALVGPVDKIKDELAKWRETCITTMLVSGSAKTLPMYAELILG
jgi:F420-dependent oxidoreductase-like protein